MFRVMGESTAAELALLRALGQEIRSMRQRRGLSRAQLADAAGVSETTIGRIERDGPSDFGDSLRIAAALKVDLVWLLNRAEDTVRVDQADAEEIAAYDAAGSIEAEQEAPDTP